MIHGDCSSPGCYAMTDEQIAEIYSLARESFFGGQKAFQIQAYPFRMTPPNMAKHRNSPHMAFWKMIKQGYDHFEVSRLEPKVDVCEKHYVFNAEIVEQIQRRRQMPRLQGAGRDHVAGARQTAPRRDPDRRVDQPRHTGRAGPDGRRRRHEPDLPFGGEVARRPRRRRSGPPPAQFRPTSIRRRRRPRLHRKLHEPRIGRIEACPRPVLPRSTVQVASAGGSGGIGGFFGNLFGSKSEDRLPPRRPRRRRPQSQNRRLPQRPHKPHRPPAPRRRALLRRSSRRLRRRRSRRAPRRSGSRRTAPTC